MRSARLIASSWSWVTRIAVMPNWRCRRLTSICMSSRRFLSSAPNGSSSRRMRGSTASARASATRCCWPPESWRGKRSREAPPSCTSGEHAPPRARSSPAPRSPGAQPEGHVLVDRHVREQRVVLEDDADVAAAGGQMVDGARRRPGRCPRSGATKPAMIRSSVVLPQPLGPSRATNSPGSMASDTPSTATRRAVADRKIVDIQGPPGGRDLR